MNHYIYAIVDRLPARWRQPAAGLGGAAVLPRRVDDVVVLGSVMDTVPPANPRNLALHHDVVTTVLDAPATLPLPYGFTVPSASLLDWLAAHRALITAALESVRGCVEMSVKVLRLDRSIDQLVSRDRGPRASAAPSPAPDEAALQALATALAERANVTHWRYRPSGSAGNVAASIAFLVERADVAGFLARIAPVASHAAGIAVVPIGPWLPASFVPELTRAPLARVPSDPLDTAARRAG